MRAMSALSSATAVPPAAIAIPTSDATRAGASLTPSPTMSTGPCPRLSSRIHAAFSSGRRLPLHSSKPAARAADSTAACRFAAQADGPPDAESAERRDEARHLGPQPVREDDRAPRLDGPGSRGSLHPTITTVPSWRRIPEIQFRRDSVRRPSSRKRRGLPSITVRSPTRARAPLPGSASSWTADGSGIPSSSAISRMALAIGCSLRLSAAAAWPRISSAVASPEGRISRTAGRDSVTVPVLSSATTRLRARTSRCTAALDEDSPAGRAGECAHRRHRRRDDERAGACDHDEDERPVAPLGERFRAEKGRDERDQERAGHHERGVDPREAVHEPLGGALLAPGLLDGLEHAPERRVLRDPVAADLERAAPVDRSPVDEVAGEGAFGDRFAGDRRGIHLRGSRRDRPVDGDALPGPDQEQLAPADLLDRNAHAVPVPEARSPAPARGP